MIDIYNSVTYLHILLIQENISLNLMLHFPQSVKNFALLQIILITEYVYQNQSDTTLKGHDSTNR